MAHGGGAADLSGGSGRVAAEAGLLQSGSAAEAAAVRQRMCRTQIYIMLEYHRRFSLGTTYDIITDGLGIEPSVIFHRRFYSRTICDNDFHRRLVIRTVCDRLARQMLDPDKPNISGSILTVCDEASTIACFVVVYYSHSYSFTSSHYPPLASV